MSGHECIETPKEGSPNKEGRQLQLGTAGACAAYRLQFREDAEFVLVVDLVDGGVGAEAEEEALDDVGHAATFSGEHDGRSLGDERTHMAHGWGGSGSGSGG